MVEREYRVLVHEEAGSCWAEVVELPGCFASGANLDELRAAVVEASRSTCRDAAPAAPSVSAHGSVEEMRVLVSG